MNDIALNQDACAHKLSINQRDALCASVRHNASIFSVIRNRRWLKIVRLLAA